MRTIYKTKNDLYRVVKDSSGMFYVLYTQHMNLKKPLLDQVYDNLADAPRNEQDIVIIQKRFTSEIEAVLFCKECYKQWWGGRIPDND